MITKYEVGKRFPLEKIIRHFIGADGGASFNYIVEEKKLVLYVALANPSNREINAFRKGLLRFALYRNDLLNTAILLTDYDTVFMVDLIYDINIYQLNVDGIVDSNELTMYLIDSNTGILHGIRTIGLGPNFMEEINQITKNDLRYTTREYNEWLQKDVYQKSLQQLWRDSERIDWNK